MKTKMISMTLAALLAAAGATSAFAQDNYDNSYEWIEQAVKNTSPSSPLAASILPIDTAQVNGSIAMNDGSILYVFKDGKMGMEDKYGKALSMKAGQVMKTKDNKEIAMNGNETSRLSELTPKYYY